MKHSGKKTGGPPRPVTKIAARLEHVRALAGIPTWKEFRQRLIAPLHPDDDFSVSYSAVRNYHFGKDPEGRIREPTVAYLARVAAVFPEVNPVWLFTGEGLPTTAAEEAAAYMRSGGEDEHAQERPLEEYDKRLKEVFPELEALTVASTQLLYVFTRLASRVALHHGMDCYWDSKRRLELASALRDYFLLPYRVGLIRSEPVAPGEVSVSLGAFADYFKAACDALALAVPEADQVWRTQTVNLRVDATSYDGGTDAEEA